LLGSCGIIEKLDQDFPEVFLKTPKQSFKPDLNLKMAKIWYSKDLIKKSPHLSRKQLNGEKLFIKQ
jgi:hypothetical protein